MEFTEEERQILIRSLRNYTNARHEFAGAIAQKAFRKRDGSEATIEEVREAASIASKCDDLCGKLSNCQ